MKKHIPALLLPLLAFAAATRTQTHTAATKAASAKAASAEAAATNAAATKAAATKAISAKAAAAKAAATKAAATNAVSAKAAPVGAPDVSGRTRRPLEEAGKQGKAAAVLFFVTTDCPIANRFAPEINRICRDYQARGLAFYIVQADASLRAEQAAAHARAYGFSVPVLLDSKHDLVRLCGARITPEVAVVSTVAPSAGRILYRGRIDDRYTSLGKPRLQPGKHDLRLALDAVCAHKPVATPRTTATGCTIEGQI